MNNFFNAPSRKLSCFEQMCSANFISHIFHLIKILFLNLLKNPVEDKVIKLENYFWLSFIKTLETLTIEKYINHLIEDLNSNASLLMHIWCHLVAISCVVSCQLCLLQKRGGHFIVKGNFKKIAFIEILIISVGKLNIFVHCNIIKDDLNNIYRL